MSDLDKLIFSWESLILVHSSRLASRGKFLSYTLVDHLHIDRKFNVPWHFLRNSSMDIPSLLKRKITHFIRNFFFI